MLGSIDPESTIAAIASPPGPAPRGIVRLSGPRAWPISLNGFVPDSGDEGPPRTGARQGLLSVHGLHRPLPATIALWRGPRSYTGQDIAEIHTLGSPPLLGLVLASCLERGARLAEPGEFTLRAFLSGRLDLTRAEAVLAVIDARTQPQLEAALEQLAGGLRGTILNLRDRLLDLVASLEANLDFVDEADVHPFGHEALIAELATAAEEIESLSLRLTRRERTTAYPRVVLTGPPNAGKSRLFNALAKEDAAIVSPQAGTTRDYLTALRDCGGITVELVDTAGLETPSGSIESQAQALREAQIRQADLLLECSSVDSKLTSLTPFATDCPSLKVQTKCDLAQDAFDPRPGSIATSAQTGQGLEDLRDAIAAALLTQGAEGSVPASTSARCRESLVRTGEALRDAARNVGAGQGDELVAFELRLAIDELGKVVGVIVTDDILDRIFQKFCIGK